MLLALGQSGKSGSVCFIRIATSISNNINDQLLPAEGEQKKLPFKFPRTDLLMPEKFGSPPSPDLDVSRSIKFK
jgi:hypothetical protein